MTFDDRPGPAMTAVRIHDFGGPEAIRHDRVPRPVPGPGQVLVRVAAAGFNPSDTGFRGGLMRGVVPVELPFTLGSEASGTVVQVGAGVTHLRVGDPVTGRTDGGATAEYLTADAALMVRVPSVLPLTHAAAVPVAGGTAWQALFEHARTEKGTRVLVNGAGGGVGMFAVQLARHAEAHVIAVAGPRSAGRVRAYGAAQIIDYTRERVLEALAGPVDLLVHAVPSDPGELLPAVRSGGALVSVTVPALPPAGSGVAAHHFVARNDPAQLAGLLALVAAGQVRVDAEVRPFAELAQVHRDAEAGRISGKVVVRP
ncbi:NADP-dependent oxidoreductase [Nonomuraea longicatena]|uniref:NADP-dependent oxidoreductase n=1 Tax=Nonomuraea longicatena TaxID=83682 RepID=A0ABN1QLD5_9ACTN